MCNSNMDIADVDRAVQSSWSWEADKCFRPVDNDARNCHTDWFSIGRSAYAVFI